MAGVINNLALLWSSHISVQCGATGLSWGMFKKKKKKKKKGGGGGVVSVAETLSIFGGRLWDRRATPSLIREHRRQHHVNSLHLSMSAVPCGQRIKATASPIEPRRQHSLRRAWRRGLSRVVLRSIPLKSLRSPPHVYLCMHIERAHTCNEQIEIRKTAASESVTEVSSHREHSMLIEWGVLKDFGTKNKGNKMFARLSYNIIPGKIYHAKKKKKKTACWISMMRLSRSLMLTCSLTTQDHSTKHHQSASKQ